MDINECIEFVGICQNGGFCINTLGGYTCRCTEQWEGANCTIDVDECKMQVCKNGATCVNTPGGFTCTCPPGWQGNMCEQDKNECLNSTLCQNNALCINTQGSFTCQCQVGWEGKYCHIDINECLVNNPCLNDAICENTPGSYICRCKPGFEGNLCQYNHDECKSNPCKFGGTCIDTVGSYICQCPPGRSGRNCDNDTDECLNNPCLNGATCENLVGSFKCTCPPGFTGERCESNINECVLYRPCKNGATCYDSFGSYSCSCAPGWTGKDCDTEINECLVIRPCQNGAECVNTPGSYKCICPPGWTGTNCEIDINECYDRPCKNGAQCINNQGSFTCICPPDFTGPLCETAVITGFKFRSIARNLTFTPGLLDNRTYEFRSHADLFCADIDKIVRRYPNAFADYKECRVVAFEDNPTALFWELVFTGDQPSLTEKQILDIVYKDLPHYYYKDSEGVVIGDIFIHINDYATTKLPLDLQILNLTWSDQLLNPNSFLFQQYSADLCRDLERIAQTSGIDLPKIVGCEVKQYGNNPARVYFDLTFEGTHFTPALQQKFFQLMKEQPLQRYKNFLGYLLGQFLIFSEYYTDYTTVPLTFRVLNLTYTSDLMDKNSARYRQHARLFCEDIDQLMRSHKRILPTYEGCEVVQFGNNPTTISIDLQFGGLVNIGEYKDIVAGIIFEDAPRFRYMNNLGHLVGDLLVFYDSWEYILHDAWLSNMTYFIHEFSYNPQYGDPNSVLYKDFENLFCGDIDNFFKNSKLADRYYRCFFTKIGDTPVHTLTFNVIFNGTEEVQMGLIQDTISKQADHFNVENKDMMFIGQQLVYLGGGMENFPINISNYLIQNFVQTTESPVNTIINASFVLLNLTWTPDLANPQSAAFKAIADPFCQYLTNLYIGRDRFRDIYEKCEVASITTDGSREKINFVLQFKGQQDETLQEYIFGILIEIAPRTTVNGQISIVVGPLAVYEQSLAIEQATVAVVTTALPIGNMGAGVTSVRPDTFLPTSPLTPTTTPMTTTTSPSPTTQDPTDPCKPSRHNEYLPVPGDCRSFYVCSFGTTYKFQCAGNTVFSWTRRICDNNDGSVACVS